jgi:hypothetical protein
MSSAFGTPPPPAVAYQPSKSAKLHDNIEEAVTNIYNLLYQRGVCRVQPTVEDLQTSSVAYFPIAVAVSADNDLLDYLWAQEPRAKFQIKTNADRDCPSIKIDRCVAIVMILPHFKFKGPTEATKPVVTESAPYSRMLVVFLLIVAVGVCIGLFAMKIPRLFIGF